MTTIGKWRRLSTLSTEQGHFAILAADHRDSLRNFLSPGAPEQISDAQLVETKLDLIELVGSLASGVMLEPEFSIGRAVASGVLPRDVAFTAALEAQGYLSDGSPTTVLDGWSVPQAAASGASGAKLLVMWDPANAENCQKQEHVIEEVVTACAKASLPLFLEPILTAGDLPEMVSMVAHMATFGPDVLKLGFPRDWEAAVSELSVATSGLPWAFLSAGVSFETYIQQLRAACDAGASGFMVGRALWGEYVQGEGPQEQVSERFQQLRQIVAQHATPWTSKVVVPAVNQDWYRR